MRIRDEQELHAFLALPVALAPLFKRKEESRSREACRR
jgi:hypothetical protein